MTNNKVKTKKKKSYNTKTGMKIKLNKIVINPNIHYIPINNNIDENIDDDYIKSHQEKIELNLNRIKTGKDEYGNKYTPDQIRAFKANITKIYNLIETYNKKN